MGWPVGHSLSPRLHGYWLEKYGIDGTYGALPVEPDRFSERLFELAGAGYAGVNVTLPHKEAALHAVHTVSPEARRIGAVNTIVMHPDGTLEGRNTDAFGFLENLKSSRPGRSAAQGPAGGPAVLIGAGGAARAIAWALVNNGAPEVRIVNRTLSRAESIARDMGGPCVVRPWEDREGALSGARLLVNATTRGMVGEPPLDLDLSNLPTEALVTDIVYTPLLTPLLGAAAARGNPVVDGLGMLLHQARPGFEAWFGIAPEVTQGLRAHVLEALKW